MSDCIFCKIAAGDIPSSKIYEDDDVIAFKDIHPQAPVHFLIVPKKHIVSLAETQSADEPLLGKMLGLVRKLAKEQGCDNGFRNEVNRVATTGITRQKNKSVFFCLEPFKSKKCLK